MTNAEKFEEVFGYKVSHFPNNPCDIVDEDYCINANGCDKCKLNNFWNKQYRQPNKDLDIIKSIRKRAKTTGLPKLEPLPPVTEFEKKR